MRFQEAVLSYAEQPLTRQLLMDMLKDYKKPHDKIDDLVKQQMLIQIKRGLYIPGPKLNIATPELFLLANHLYGPSYISLDSALAYWGLIPERVYEISSVTTQKSKTYKTAAGKFSYTYVALPFYSFGIKQEALSKKQTVLIASPEKALCDKIITTSGVLLRSIKQTAEVLMEDCRIEKAMLSKLDTTVIRSWLKNAPQQNSLKTLVKTLESL